MIFLRSFIFVLTSLCGLSLVSNVANAQTQLHTPEKKDPLQDSIGKYSKLGQYALVVPFAEKWVEKCKEKNGEESAKYGGALNILGDALNRSGKSEEAEPILLQGLEIRKKALGENHPDVGNSLSHLGMMYSYMGNFPKAEPLLLQALEIRKKTLAENHQDIAASLNSLGVLYLEMGVYPKAEPYFLQSLEINKKTLGENHPRVAATQSNLGLVYTSMGNFPKAEIFYLQALEIRRKVLGEDHPDMAISLSNLGSFYMETGNYPKAELYYFQALEVDKKNLGDNHPDVAASLMALGNFYRELGDFPKAEPYLLEALKIQKNTLGENHPYVALTLRNLGVLYDNTGDYLKATAFYLQSLEIRKKTLGENHPDVAETLNSISSVYIESGNYRKAELSFLEALEIWKTSLGNDHYNVAICLENLGSLYAKMDNYAKAETYLIQALDIYKKTWSENHPQMAFPLQNLGGLYELMGNYPKAEANYLKALEIRKKNVGANHPETATLISGLGSLYFAQKQMTKAEVKYLDWNGKKQAQIQRYFPFLSDQEKEKFYESKLVSFQEYFKSFCVERYAGKNAISVDLFNDQLATKGLLLNSSAKWKHRIRTSGDTAVSALFTRWETSRNRLNKLLQSTDSTERAGIDSVEKKTETMEKELSLRSENFTKLADKELVTWKQVQKTLKPGEAAIEMVRVNKFGISKTLTDTSNPKKPVYRVKGLTDTIYYAALIVKPESQYPEMVLLKNGNDLEGKHLLFYQNSVSKQLPDNQSYGKFWEKIGTKLGTSTRVYFSPDGVFHNINLNTLFNPKTKKFLLEEKDIRLVTSTKDLVNPSPVEEENKLAELVGFPSYYANSPTASVTTTERKSPEMSYGLRLETIGTLAELPATKTEVDKIARVLEGKGWEVKNYTGGSALEQTIKESYKPRVLHIATHGFFQPDSTKGSNPLLRSGLMLTGAGSTLKGEKNETGEDGILTAYEAMNLNLDNTDLVVLSACETGLGEIKNGEGVYGLQRAFKVAGARSIIMSLWKVDDAATQELMVSFYKNWLENRTDSSKLSVRSKRQAFLAAQKELKAKYPNPYYWGAFVMVGE